MRTLTALIKTEADIPEMLRQISNPGCVYSEIICVGMIYLFFVCKTNDKMWHWL